MILKDIIKYRFSLDTDYLSIDIYLLRLLHERANNFLKGATRSQPDVPDNHIPSYPLSSLAPVKTFVQRTSLRENIREQLCRKLKDDRMGETKKVGIWGLGGAGKSQLALGYLQRYRADYEATFWIQAGQAASIDRDFLQIYQSLPSNPPLQSHQAEDARRAVLNWFTRRAGKWLIVFDGADHLHKGDQNFVDLSRYIPGHPNVHVIITSRSSTAGKLSTFEGVNVGQLEEVHAVDLFFRCAEIPRREKTEAEVEVIVKELGCLALAITIAGTYVSQTPRLSSNLPAYLEEYHQRRKDLLDEQPDELIHRYDHSVMTVWETSYSSVYDQLPEACRVLTLLAFINYEDIFLDLFGLESYTSAVPIGESWTSVISAQGNVNIHDFEKCFAILERYSLLHRQRNNKSLYSMHRLVHAWSHDRLLHRNRQDIKLFCLAALQLLYKAVFNCINLPEAKLRLVPHLRENFDAVRRLQTDNDSESDGLLDMLEYIGDFTADIGSWREAAAIRKGGLEKRQQIFGYEHPNTISAMNNLAITLGDQGKLEEAVIMKREVLEKRQRILGHEHPDTILAMNNLAITLGDQGKLEEAVAILREVVEKRQRILGHEHPKTISAMANLTTILRAQGNLKGPAINLRGLLGALREKLRRR
jgi:tetratricopeptide (TPR) repeat protein